MKDMLKKHWSSFQSLHDHGFGPFELRTHGLLQKGREYRRMAAFWGCQKAGVPLYLLTGYPTQEWGRPAWKYPSTFTARGDEAVDPLDQLQSKLVMSNNVLTYH